MPKGVYPRKKKGKKAPAGPQARLAAALERLTELYELDLRSRGLTTRGADLVGEILLTDPETILKEERKAHVRRELGLPDGFDLDAAIPRWDYERGVELPSPAEEAKKEAETQASPGADRWQEGYSSPWGVGPEGAEDPKGGADEARG